MIQQAAAHFLTKHRVVILSLLLAFFSLPSGFYLYVGEHLDSSWVRAINLAVKNHLVFGRDIVFTYGPLGFLSTRNTQYVSDWVMLAADLFSFLCYFYLFRRLLQSQLKWFWLAAIALLYFKGTEYACQTFCFFILFSVLAIKNNFQYKIELLVCCIAAVLVFFVKINYGIVALPLLALLIAYALYLRSIYESIGMLVFSGIFFLVLALTFHINLGGYIKNNILLIAGYNESMQLEIDPFSPPYLSALLYTTLVGTLAITYFLVPRRQLTLEKLISIAFLSIMFYLVYKNGFTRNDGHNDGFFGFMPLFLLLSISSVGLASYRGSLAIVVAAIIISDTNLKLPRADGRGFILNNIIGDSTSYYHTFFEKQKDIMKLGSMKLPKSTLETVGSSSIDIMPIDVTLIHVNGLNYKPRPIPQSYSAYSRPLDSINAAHFCKPGKPDFVLLWIWSIDNRMVSWDESMAKAALRLNYEYAGFSSLAGDTTLSNGHGNYLLLKASKNAERKPIFKEISSAKIRFDDTLKIDFPRDQAIYAALDINYNLEGKIKNIIYNPTLMYADLFFDGGRNITHRMIRPIAAGPILINKAICMNSEFVTFMKGDIVQNTDVKAISFHAERNTDVDPEIYIRFYRFENY